MHVEKHDGLACYTFDTLEGEGLCHAVFARHGGVSEGFLASLNVGHTVGDDPARVEANHQLIYRALGIDSSLVVTASQVHGARVRRVGEGDAGSALAQTDALITSSPGLSLLLRFADCVPLLFYAPRHRAVGLAHAGWQGTLKGIAAQAARAMMMAFQCGPEDLLVGIGPSIGPCCFQVGAELVARVQEEYGGSTPLLSRFQGDGRAHWDLWRTNVLQLQQIGVKQTEVAGLCTCCRVHDFYSHRGEHGHTGRFAVIVGVRQGAAGS